MNEATASPRPLWKTVLERQRRPIALVVLLALFVGIALLLMGKTPIEVDIRYRLGNVALHLPDRALDRLQLRTMTAKILRAEEILATTTYDFGPRLDNAGGAPYETQPVRVPLPVGTFDVRLRLEFADRDGSIRVAERQTAFAVERDTQTLSVPVP